MKNKQDRWARAIISLNVILREMGWNRARALEAASHGYFLKIDDDARLVLVPGDAYDHVCKLADDGDETAMVTLAILIRVKMG